MKKTQTFEDFWNQFGHRPLEERREYFASLSRNEQLALIRDFFDSKWYEVVAHNIIDERLDYIKRTFGIDLIEMRLQARSLNKVFLVDKEVWNSIEELMMEFEDFYDPNLVFGDLVISEWGENKKFCKITRKELHE